ncbi:MAG TPA: glycerol-3-phosphate dehydrogenase/oxidase [Pyrinomonadaceae bacterium]|nr:glycerol-3-phosphate dehydrogenase/oxidase [Pyrinomonadaceae bacterium]
MPDEISETNFDVIIIGAGINGAGIARDAAMRGLKVLLLDKGDIGGGTSSWSTRLIHGGLRYLEHGEFGLVRESLRERETLLRIAPHLVRPLPILIPIYKGARRGRLMIKAGMIAYDALSFGKSLPGHRMLSREETLRELPDLNREGLVGAAIYYDAQVEFPERLVLENVLSAVAYGAQVHTYASVEKLLIEGDRVRGVEFTQGPKSNFLPVPLGEGWGAGGAELNPSPLSPFPWEGDEKPNAGTQTATASIVINAAGPWVDQILTESAANSPKLIGGTKGSHLIVASFPGAPKTGLYVEAETDGRPFFIIPWNGKYLIGTTDIRFSGDLDRVSIEEDEVDYLLHETNRIIPDAKLTRGQILFTYSGVRPLPFAGDENEGSITRRHFIRAHPRLRGLLSIVGGKLTTYRSLAEETVDRVLSELGRTAIKCVTEREALPGADAGTTTSVSPDDRLARIYGRRASLIMDLAEADPSLTEVFDEETGAIAAEIVFAFKNELAQTLTDCLLRRTMVGLNSTCGLEAVYMAGAIAQKHLGWAAGQTQDEIAEYQAEVKRRLTGAGASPPSGP